jgi:endonuclease I
MDKGKLHSCLAIGFGIAAAAFFAVFLITVFTAGAVGWRLVFALAPLTAATLVLNKDKISRRPRLAGAIARVGFFLAGFTALFTVTAAIWITPWWLFMLFTAVALFITACIFRRIAGETGLIWDKDSLAALVACSVLFVFVFFLFSVPSFAANNGKNPRDKFGNEYYKKHDDIIKVSGYLLYADKSRTYMDSEIDHEHIIAQKWGETAKNANKNLVNDLHNVLLAIKSVNNRRGHYEFGEVTPHNTETAVKDADNNICGYLGTNAKGKTVFEPLPNYKGDVARAVLYMDATYGGGDFDKSKIDIELMKRWARLDRVSPEEKARNAAIEAVQGNTNKFVDIPWLVNFAV